MNPTHILIIPAILLLACTDQLQDAKSAVEVQRETCDGVALLTTERIEAVRAVDEKIADGIERLQKLCGAIDAGKLRIKEAADDVSDVVSE